MTTVSGYLSLLQESDPVLLEYALTSLDAACPQAWAEMAGWVPTIGRFAKDAGFPHQKLAALVCSKVHYFLDEMEESLEFALSAGDLFDVTQNSEYISTLVAKAIDTFVTIRIKRSELSASANAAQEVRRFFLSFFSKKKKREVFFFLTLF